MCSQFQVKLPLHVVEQSFSHTRFPLRFPEGRPNAEPRDQVTIGDRTMTVVSGEDGADLLELPFGWKGPRGRPVFNFRSEGRQFTGSRRCLIPASGFYEFTDPQPGQKRKTRWLFTMVGHPWFWVAGIVREGAFAMLTTEPGPDVAPYHDRQIVLLKPDQAVEWLGLVDGEDDLFRPLEGGSLAVTRDFPSLADQLFPT